MSTKIEKCGTCNGSGLAVGLDGSAVDCPACCPDPFAYPWEGGNWYITQVRIFGPDEPDEDGDTTGQYVIGAGDYCDSGEPDLVLSFPPGVDRRQVEWVASAIELALDRAGTPDLQ